ncbi:MAG: cytochrome c-550 PedF [Rubrimonas sp.]
MTRTARLYAVLAAKFAGALAASAALAHGDVAPQAVDTSALPSVGEEWLTENPYRGMDPEIFARAISIGASGYNQNCARCHGLEAVSGGLAPDLRYLEAEEYGDEWYMERYIAGYTQNGVTKMPAFGDLLGQEAGWAIRSYIETRPDDESMAEQAGALQRTLAMLSGIAEQVKADPAAYAAVADEVEEARADLAAIAEKIETLSGAPFADSPAHRAAAAIDGNPEGVARAAEILTVGLSKAH